LGNFLVVPRLTVQPHEEWQPLREPRAIGVLDRTPDDLTAALGWAWDEFEEDGLGQMFYAPLAWDGNSRFLLSASGLYPGDGIAIEAEGTEDPASARGHFMRDTGLGSDAFLAIAEGDTWFARWDPPHNAGVRPSTASPRSAGG
jgi:hypothetical protein